MFQNENEYLDDILKVDRQKPVVHYKKTVRPIMEDAVAYVTTVDHPAEYLNKAPYVITSRVISYDAVTGEFETRNTKYVPLKDGE